MKTQHICIFLFFLLIGISLFFGEHIPANDGLGYDGLLYAAIAQKFPSVIQNHALTSYQAQRIFPSFLIYSFSEIFGFSTAKQNLPFLFSLLNTCMLLVCVCVWASLAKKQAWSPQIKLISFAGLFLNFANLKMPFYYSVLTDTTAFTIGLSMLYCYLNKKNLALLILSMVGAWTFPTLLYMGMILYLFPVHDNKSTLNNFAQYTPLIGFIIAALITIMGILVALKVPGEVYGKDHSLPMFCLSSLFLFIYLFSAFKYLTPYRLKLLASFLIPKRLLIVLFSVVVITFAIKFISGPQASAINLKSHFFNILNQALAYPFNFIISHTLYYGAAIGFLIFFWKDIAAYIFQKGPGLFLVTGMYALLSLTSESRQLINFFPFVVVMVAEILNKKPISWSFTSFFVLLNLTLSRFWLPLNHGGDWASVELALEFPLQWYFMNFGPWLSPSMYKIAAVITIVTFGCLYIGIKKKN